MNEAVGRNMNLEGVGYMEDVITDAIEFVETEPLLADVKTNIIDAIAVILDSLRESTPSSSEEIAYLCDQINESIYPLLEVWSTFDRSTPEYRTYEKVFAHIRKLRKTGRLAIKSVALDNGNWSNPDIEALEVDPAVKVREVVLGYFGFTEEDLLNVPVRNKLKVYLDATASDDYRFVVGIASYYRSEYSKYKSMWELMSAAFPEFDDMLNEKETLVWQVETRVERAALARRVRKMMEKEFGIPSEVPVNDFERRAVINQILEMKPTDLRGKEGRYQNGFGRGKAFESFVDFMYFLYGRLYNIKKDRFKERDKNFRNSPNLRKAECRKRFLAGLDYKEKDVPKGIGSDEWWEFMSEVTEVSVRDLYAPPFSMGEIIKSSGKPPFEYVSFVFKDLGFKKCYFTKFGRKLLKIRDEHGTLVAPRLRDRDAVNALLDGDETAIQYAIDSLTKRPSRIPKEDFDSQVREKVTKFLAAAEKVTPVNVVQIVQVAGDSISAKVNREFRAKQVVQKLDSE